ncbi:hypothetical protein G6F64_002573 [Rhizopus arrhizus]|uniref:Uncharacterized protein n=1 Tax=Rhizopus oryzae TaxID=64495 RepID=A0A9P7BVR9_RHIOR|nr:hypothetical protein G6F64_002573 [Rhizopus arrhizus]
MQITKRRKSIRPVESITTEKSSVTRNTASSLAKLKDVSTKKRTATKKLSSLDTLQKRNSLVDKKAPVSLETSESPVDFPKRLSEESLLQHDCDQLRRHICAGCDRNVLVNSDIQSSSTTSSTKQQKTANNSMNSNKEEEQWKRTFIKGQEKILSTLLMNHNYMNDVELVKLQTQMSALKDQEIIVLDHILDAQSSLLVKLDLLLNEPLPTPPAAIIKEEAEINIPDWQTKIAYDLAKYKWDLSEWFGLLAGTGEIDNEEYDRFGYTEDVVISGVCVTTEPGLLPKRFQKYYKHTTNIICLKYKFTLNRSLRLSNRFRLKEQNEWTDCDRCQFSFFMDDEHKGIGVDILHLPRLSSLVIRRGREKLAKRILSKKELIEFNNLTFQHEQCTMYLATRWCIKEAVYKALYPIHRLEWKQVTVIKEAGKPVLLIENSQLYGIHQTHVSVSHDGDYAMAQVILEGDQLVKALDGAFHPLCFTCWDCDAPVASSYLPHPTQQGQPLCERDYFKHLKLVCAECDEPLLGTYIIALDKKYHPEHFTCSDCSTVFGPDDCYYEHDRQVYCHFHYSTRFAIACAGCNMAILKQYVEIERENSIVDHWHPECYMIQKFWGVKIAHPLLKEGDQYPTKTIPQTANELSKLQKETEEKVISIWSVLSAFEESSAVCISEMLLHVSNGSYIESICLSERFLVHVEALFAGIDKICAIYLEYHQPEFKYAREAKMLCKKIINFFSLLSRIGDMEMKRLGITQELLSLVTGLAHYLKILIRLTLNAALSLEMMMGKSVAIPHLLARLMEIPGKERHSRDSQRLIHAKNTDYCQECKNIIEDQCMRHGDYRWHIACFKCFKCACPLKIDSATMINTQLHCLSCVNSSPCSFSYVSKLTQYSYLLRVALSRLCNLLQVTDSQLSSVDYSTKLNHTKANHILKDVPANMVGASKELQQMIEERGQLENIYPTEIKDAKTVSSSTTRLDRKMSRSFKMASKRSTLLGGHNALPTRTDSLHRRSVGLDDLPHMAAAAVTGSISQPCLQPRTQRIYLSELSALQYMIIRYVAVVQIEPYVRSSFSSTELLNMIESKKSSIWGKFFPFRSKKSQPKSMGTFGVPLDILTDRTGVESNLALGPSPVRLAAFIDDAITAMRQKDMSVEGIFRKNGNHRRLNELTEALDKAPAEVDLTEENAVQVAALLKKFFRELPDPLMTHRLYRLFMCADRIEQPERRKRALHLACCMLPMTNRVTMEALFLFLRWVATYSHVTDELGSRMDIPNLARVIAPNILCAKDPLKDESFDAIHVVATIMESCSEFCLVPQDLEVFLKDPNLSEMDMSPKEFLKKVEQTVKHQEQRPLENTAASSSKASIYTPHQYLPYTNQHPSSDFIPKQARLPPRRKESFHSFHP